MKQLKFITMAAAVFAILASQSSCVRSDDPVQPESVDLSAEPLQYSVTVTSTAEATFSIDVPATAVPSADKKSVVFTDITTLDTPINITATLINAEGYVIPSQTASVMFASDDNNDQDIAFDFVKRSTEIKTQQEVENATTDIVINSNPADFETQLVIPAGTKATGNTVDPYSITCYAPAPKVIDLNPAKSGLRTRSDDVDDDDDDGDDDDDEDDDDDGDDNDDSHIDDDEGEDVGDFTIDLMNMDCTPHGAQFSKSITLKVNVGEDLAGEDLTLEDENGEEQEAIVQSDGSVQFAVNHFSFKKLKKKIKKLKRKGIYHTKLKEEKNVLIQPGSSHKVSYKKHQGLQQVNPKKKNKALTKFIKSCKEQHKRKSVYRKFSSKTGCYADILIYQKYYKYTGKFKKKKYTFRYWKETGYNLEKRPLNSGQSGHSGGSGN